MPAFLLCDRIPGDQYGALVVGTIRSNGRWSWCRWLRTCPARINANVRAAGFVLEFGIYGERAARIRGRRDVDQTRGWIERHRRPVMRPARAGSNGGSLSSVVGFLVENGPPGFFVEALGPRHFRERLARNELAREPVQHIIEPVLVGLHDHLAQPALDGHIRDHQLLHAVVIPFIARHHLEIPFQLAGLWLYRDNGTHI